MNENDLIQQVGEWATRNFDQHFPALGIVEEIGEAAHAELKKLQKIREYESPIKFMDDFSDAIGDCMIFLAHWCYLHNATFQFDKVEVTSKEFKVVGMNSILSHMFHNVAVLFGNAATTNSTVACGVAQTIVDCLKFWAAKYNLDIRLVTQETWLRVSKRNWKKNSVTG